MHEEIPRWADFIGAWDLYRDPIYAGVVAGLVLGYLGVFVVLRRLVFITAAVSQAAGLGVALSFYAAIHLDIAVPPSFGAIVLALLTAALFAATPEKIGLSRGSLLGFAYLTAWAGAVLVGDRIAQESHDIAAILFGSAVLVRPRDLRDIELFGAIVMGAHLWAHRGLAFAAFDPAGARVQGLPVRWLDLGSWASIAVMVSVATRALGVLPVFAMAVLPAMAAMMIARRLPAALAIAAVLGAVSGGLGYLFAFFFSFPVGASQAMVASLIFMALVPVRLLLRR